MSDCDQSCDGCPRKAEHHLCDACCHEEPDAINRENEKLREEIERLKEDVTRVPIATLEDVEEAYDLGWCNGAAAMREAVAVFVERNIDSLMLRKGLAEDLRDLPTPGVKP